MFTYIMRIQHLSKRNPPDFVWRHYDELFRRLRVQAPTLPWHAVNTGILAEAQDQVTMATSNAFRRPANNGFNAANKSDCGSKNYVCFDFNERDKRCERLNCKYPHKCSKCGGSHPAWKCRPTGAATSANSTASSTSKPVNKPK